MSLVVADILAYFSKNSKKEFPVFFLFRHPLRIIYKGGQILIWGQK